ncbi:MAG: ion transporter [Bacteroidales bacterium]|jgi:voltage-gated potassium channel|nr:ion transporter [Bacteroidales bacterium]
MYHYHDQSLRKRLYIVIFGTHTKAGRFFDIVLLIMILLSVLVVILESVTSYRIKFAEYFFIIEWIFTILFTVEYLLRLYCSPHPIKYSRSFFGVVDLLSILPTYLSLMYFGMQYFVIIRILRLLRIFRILKLANYLHNAKLLGKALKASAYKMAIFMTVVVALIIIIGSLMYVIEGESHGFTNIPQSIYWTVVTITTVGYGDIAPETVWGKFFASIVMLLGYAIIAVPTGIVTVEFAKSPLRFHVKAEGHCHECGEIIDEKDSFCRHCGEQIIQE